MRKREDGDTETIRAAHRFVARHDELRVVQDTGTYRKLGELLDSIERRAAEQATQGMAAEGATQASHEARTELIEGHMNPIAAIARLLELDHPELKSIRMPQTYLRVNALGAHAVAMAVEAAKYKDHFVRLGMPDDFVEQMHAAVQRCRKASAQPGEHRAARRGATEGGEDDLKHAKKRLAALDSLVQREIHDNAALMAEWKAVKTYPARRKAGAEVIAPVAEPPGPLMLPAPANPIEVTASVGEKEPAKRPALWTLRGLFRT